MLKLKKTLYGLKQAGRNCYQVPKDFLVSKEGFKMCTSDNCVFVKDEGKIMLLIYVDDMIIFPFNSTDGFEL